MGNCIAGSHYVEAAAAGHAILLALHTADDAIAANAELKSTAHGWRINEIRARFNQDPDPLLVTRTREWVNALARPTSELAEPAHAVRELSVRVRSLTAVRRVRDAGAVLQLHLREATGQPETVNAGRVMAGLSVWTSRGTAPNPEPAPALTALRRAGISTLARAVEQSLRANPYPSLADLWRATADRPLRRAITALPRAESQRLQPLLFDLPLLGSLRPLARMRHVASARTSHLVALRLRRAIAVLIGQDSSVVAQSIDANPDSSLIRAAALAITSRGGIPLEKMRPPGPAEGMVTAVSRPGRVHLPGCPASALNDDLWQAAWPDALELGATSDIFWDHIAAHGLLLPTSWIAHSWPVLWAQASRDD